MRPAIPCRPVSCGAVPCRPVRASCRRSPSSAAEVRAVRLHFVFAPRQAVKIEAPSRPLAPRPGSCPLVPRNPSDRSTPPYAGGPSAPALGSQVPSVAFAPQVRARLPWSLLTQGKMTTLQASLDAADRPVAIAPLRRRGLPRRREPCNGGPWRLPGPDSHRLAAVSLPLGYVTRLPLSSARRPSC